MDPRIVSKSAERIRVVHVIQNMNYGGMERLLASIIERTDPRRFELHLVVLQFLGRFAEGLEAHATLHVVPPLGRGSMLWPGALIGLLRRLRPAVVHAHSGVWWKAMLASRLARVPAFIYTEHGRPQPDPQPGRFIDRLASRGTSRVVAVSEALRRQLIETLGVDPSCLDVIPNGIDLPQASGMSSAAESIRAELRLPPSALVIGSVGRLEHIKGYDVMVEAFGRLVSGWPRAPRPALVVVGEGALRSSLEQRARELGVGADVHLLGWRDDVARWLAGFDLFTLASRSEGTSISLLEAMAGGLCPVVTDVGGNRAVLGDGLAHRLVAAEDPGALAAAWEDVLADSEARTRDASLAVARVREAYSLDRMVSAYESLYIALTAPPA